MIQDEMQDETLINDRNLGMNLGSRLNNVNLRDPRVLWGIGGLLIGMGVMFIMDPLNGSQRRSTIRTSGSNLGRRIGKPLRGMFARDENIGVESERYDH